MPTKQDFLDGKCDEQGNPITKDAPVEETPTQPTAPEEVETVADEPTTATVPGSESETIGPDTSNVEVNVDQPEEPKESE